jgi:Zn-dependent peptidase ImmA (M78 family)/DNA-binding XRE family transcriptional regulator
MDATPRDQNAHELLPQDSHILGQRLQEARSRRGLTQQDAAEHLDVARTTITAIEKGERRVRAGELIRLAELYTVPVSEIVRQRPPTQSFVVQFRSLLRRTDRAASELEQRTYDFQRLCEDYLELERLCRAPLRRREPPEYDLLREGEHGISPEEAGEELALAERRRLGLGDGPIPDVRYVLETDVGMRIFGLELPSDVAGIFAYTEDLGGCVAFNVRHPVERCRVSMAHEYAHFLTSRYRPEFTYLGRYQRVPAFERLATVFSVAFLLPGTGLRPRFHAVQRSKGGVAGVTPADLCTLADYFGVSLEALTVRLEDLHLLPPGTWERLKTSGLRVREAQTLLDLKGPQNESIGALPLRYQRLAVTAFQLGHLSQGQLAKFLRTDIVTSREVAERLGTLQVVEEDGSVERLSVDLGEAVGPVSA